MQVRIYTRQCLIYPIEQIHIPDFSGTVKDLLAREVRDFAPDKLSVSIYIDGKKASWDTPLFDVEELKIIIEPQGVEAAFAIVAAIVAVASVAYSLYMMNRLKADNPAKTSDTSTIYDVNAQGNKVRLQQVVPENFGLIKHFPDYLADKHTFYRRNKKYIDMILCQGAGWYDYKTDGSDIYIGNTPFSGYSNSDVRYQVFDPGADVSANGIEEGMHKCWYSSTEVTSSGKTLDPFGNVDPGESGGYVVYTGGKATANYHDGGLSWLIMPKSFCGVYWAYVGYRPSVTTGGGQAFALAAAKIGVKAGDYIRITNAPDDDRLWANDADADAVLLDSGNVRITWAGTWSDLACIADTSVNVTLGYRYTTYYRMVSGECNVISYSAADGKITIEISGLTLPEEAVSAGGYTVTITQALSDSVLDPLTGEKRLSDNGTYEITEVGSTTVEGNPANPSAGGNNTSYEQHTEVSAPVYTVRRIDPDTDKEIPWSGFWGQNTWYDGVPDDALTVSYQVNADAAEAKEYAGPYRACPIGASASEYEVDIDFPAGLGYLNGSGKYDERTVTLSIEWRKLGTSAWTAYEYTKTAGTGDELAETITFTFPAGQYECRIKNKSDKVDDAAQVDTVKWTGLKSCIAQPTSYAGMTTILCRFRGSETLSELSENQIATFWTRELPAVNGTDLTVTEDVAPVVQYILNNSKYAGIIDHNSLAALDAYCKSNGYTLTGTIDDDSTLLDELRNALKVCMSEPTVSNNFVSFARMTKKSDSDAFQQIFMPQNLTAAPVVNLTFAKDDDVKEIELSYIDSVTWKTSTYFYHLDDAGDVVETTYATTNNAEKLDTWGIKGTDDNHTQARALAERRLKFLTYCKTQYEIQTELDGLNCQYLDYVGLVLPQELSNVTGRITAYDSAAKTITVDQSIPARFDSGVVYVRKKDGSSINYAFVRKDALTLEISGNFIPWDPEYGATIEYPFFVIGEIVPCWVQSVEPGDKSCTLKLVNYDSRIFE